MSDTCTYDCSAQPTEISANGDISGIGVTTAFFATAWIVVLLLIGYYLVAYNPELDPFRRTGMDTRCQHPNAIDHLFLHASRKLPGLRSLQKTDWHQHSRLESALNKCVIMFADIQIFTGLAVMISGYIALSCGLQSYHWQLVVYLVWLASLTHLAALSFLRNHLANHPGKLVWRVTAMFLMMMLLEVAAGLTGYFSWDKGISKPSDLAVCYFGKRMDTNSVAFESMLKTIILLAYSFFIRLAKMSKPFEGLLRGTAARLSTKGSLQPRDPPQQNIQSVVSETLHYFCIALWSFLGIHLNILTSFLAEVYWLILSTLWVTGRFFKTRRQGPKEEDKWTFGQVLPVLLVVAPLAALVEHFFHCQASNEDRRRGSSETALLGQDQGQTNTRRDEAQDDVRVEMDHQHMRSAGYRGGFLLAAVGYIQVGIFFVAELSPGIKGPLIKIGVAFFVLNPLMQLFWIQSTLLISRMNHGSLVKKTCLGAVLSAFMCISANEFLQVSTESESDMTNSVFSYLVPSATFTGGYLSSAAMLGHNRIFAGESGFFNAFFCILYPLGMTSVCALVGTQETGSRGPSVFAWSLCACVLTELAFYGLELFMDRMKMAPMHAACLRCTVLLCILAALVAVRLTTSVAPGTMLLTCAIMASAALWSLVGAISSFVKRRRMLARQMDH